ncbi:MAG: DNA polymerase I [Ruminococcaceae bacterium]|nr:DNA polymerase I [Oscillospiraceae bacterium]
MKKLLVIDGNSILNRAFYGVKPLSSSEGIPTNAIFGFVNILNKNLEAIKPDYAAVAFDLKAPTFRHKMYDGYKSGRKGMPEELAEQLPYAKQIVTILGLTVLEKEGYEADDILGTLATLADDSTDSYILTGDRDSLQLINDKTTVLLATNNEPITFNRAAFVEKYGVQPEQFVDVKALMGDSSDNIPGVAGIGEKTALKLISEFGSLDALYAALPAPSLSAGVNAKLEAGRESAFLSRTLAKICTEMPLDKDFSDIARRELDRGEAYKLFTKLELSSFIKKFALDSEVPEETAEFPLPTSDKFVEGADFYAINYFDGVLTVCDGKAIYKTADKVEIEQIILGQNCVCYDYKEIYKRLAKDGIAFDKCLSDIMLAAYVLNPGESGYELSKLVLRFLGNTPSENIETAQYIYEIYHETDKKIIAENAEKLLSDIELPTAKVLGKMELSGFKIDRDGIERYGEQLLMLEKELAERIYWAAGGEFNINSPKQLGEVLFERLGLPHGKKTKTGYSTNAETLEKLRPYNEIIEDILDYRQVAKLRSTYAEGLLREADETGRIHTNFKQTGTATGRLSSTEPNLQNIPIKTELGREFRRYFIAENENYVLIDADYSQIELRILAHISGDENMIRAFTAGEDIHTATAARVFGVNPESVTLEMRKRAKAVNFGILYGMGEFRLANDLHISMKQAKQYIESYLASYPKIAEYLDRVKEEARRDGYVTTMMGRRRYIPELAGKNKNLQAFGERVAMNSPIQGSAADIIKIAMINVAEKLKGLDARLILQVHDELLIEASLDCAYAAEQILREEMENAVKLSVPLDVDISVGENWY